MNASIQFLKSVPKINNLIRNFRITQAGSSEQLISGQLSNILKEMDKKDVTPKLFVGYFLNTHP
jgi:hypothetical protein